MKTILFFLLILACISGFAQLKVTQSVRYYKDATFDKSPTIPVADGANKAITLQQARDSFFVKRDTVSLGDYISGAGGQLARFRGDSAVVGITNGSEGQVMKIISGLPAWGSGGSSSGTADSIRVLSSNPATGNIYLHATDKRIRYKTGGYWYRLAVRDSIPLFTKTLVDSYSETNFDGSRGIHSQDNDGLGQCFTPSTSGTLESVKFYMYKEGTPTGNAVVKLYAITGIYGTSGIPTGSVLATSDNFDVSTLTDSFAKREIGFTGANKYNVTASTHYAVVIEFSGGNSTNRIEVAHDGSSPTHNGNSFALDGGSYWVSSDLDLIFEVYVNVAN